MDEMLEIDRSKWSTEDIRECEHWLQHKRNWGTLDLEKELAEKIALYGTETRVKWKFRAVKHNNHYRVYSYPKKSN